MSDVRFRCLDFLGYPGYEVGTDGSLWGLPRPMRPVRHRRHPAKCNGYLVCGLFHNSRRRQFYIHHLILFAFVGPRRKGKQARHLNGDPCDNRAENLAWGTPQENAADKVRHGTMPQGEKSACAKLSDAEVLAIRASFEAGEGKSVLARRFGVSYGTIGHVTRGRSWTHLPDCDQAAHQKNFPRGQKHYRTKFKDDDIRAIRAAVAGGESQVSVARRLGIKENQVSRIINRVRWGHVD